MTLSSVCKPVVHCDAFLFDVRHDMEEVVLSGSSTRIFDKANTSKSDERKHSLAFIIKEYLY